MLNVDEVEDIFFDSADYLCSEESAVEEEGLLGGNFGYEIWLSELQSVDERREKFLLRMGFAEFSAVNELELKGLERVTESSGAISSSGACSSANVDGSIVCERRESNGDANCAVDDSDHDWLDEMAIQQEKETDHPFVTEELINSRVHASLKECNDKKKSKTIRRWKQIIPKMKRNKRAEISKETKSFTEAGKAIQMKMQQNKKRFLECTAMYSGQEINAHNGPIWTMKFSPDGQYLATGGEDGIVCVWHVSSVDLSCNIMKCNFGNWELEDKSSSRRKKSNQASVILPERIFHIGEEPLQKLHGHSGDVFDLAWSRSNYLLSACKDRTVRLWQVGSDKCLGVFHHNNYVTCVQFNPMDEKCFISGSIDGKVRIWGVPKGRVAQWADARDLVTAICYHPDGQGFVVGSVSGSCRFYEISGGELQLNAELNIQGRKKSSGNKITGIQFLKDDSHRVMITSEDSKIRILDGFEVVQKYRGLTKSGSQMSASFTGSGRHIISIGNDSRIYVWNYNDMGIPSSKETKSIRSCEHLLFDGVTVALPWSANCDEQNVGSGRSESSILSCDCQASCSKALDSERFSLANWFSMDNSSRSSVTWPEEKLPLFDLPSTEHEYLPCISQANHLHQRLQCNNTIHSTRLPSTTWGLGIVAAGRDGTIRTIHNFGLPVRI